MPTHASTPPRQAVPQFGGHTVNATSASAGLGLGKVPTPSEIVSALDAYVVGQSQAKRVLAVATHNHFKRVAAKQQQLRAALAAPTVLGDAAARMDGLAPHAAAPRGPHARGTSPSQHAHAHGSAAEPKSDRLAHPLGEGLMAQASLGHGPRAMPGHEWAWEGTHAPSGGSARDAADAPPGGAPGSRKPAGEDAAAAAVASDVADVADAAASAGPASDADVELDKSNIVMLGPTGSGELGTWHV